MFSFWGGVSRGGVSLREQHKLPEESRSGEEEHPSLSLSLSLPFPVLLFRLHPSSTLIVMYARTDSLGWRLVYPPEVGGDKSITCTQGELGGTKGKKPPVSLHTSSTHSFFNPPIPLPLCIPHCRSLCVWVPWWLASVTGLSWACSPAWCVTSHERTGVFWNPSQTAPDPLRSPRSSLAHPSFFVSRVS